MSGPDPFYVLNKNPDGVDTLHRNPGERCNTDDATGRTRVDPTTGKALEESGDVHLCAHCYPKEEAHP